MKYSYLESNTSRLYTSVLFFLFWLALNILMFFGFDNGFIRTSFALILTSVSGLLVLRSMLKHNILYFVIFVFVFLYAYVSKSVLIDNILPSAFCKLNHSESAVLSVTSIFSLFMIVLYKYVIIKDGIFKKISLWEQKSNILIFSLNLLIFIFILLFGRTGDNIFTSGGYGLGDTGTSVLVEYSVIFLLNAYLYSGYSKNKKALLFVFLCLFCIKSILYGGRIEVLYLAMLFLIVYLVKKLSFYKAVFLICMGVWVMLILGQFRSNPVDFISNLPDSLFQISHGGSEYLASNEGDVYYASERILMIMEDGLLDTKQRITSALSFLASVFIPFSMLPPEANLTTFLKDLYPHGGGGLAPVYTFVFLSYLGVVLLSFMTGFILNNIGNRKQILNVFCILAFCTFPRWFAYYPIILFKLCVIGAIYSYCMVLLDRTIKRKSINNILQ